MSWQPHRDIETWGRSQPESYSGRVSKVAPGRSANGQWRKKTYGVARLETSFEIYKDIASASVRMARWDGQRWLGLWHSCIETCGEGGGGLRGTYNIDTSISCDGDGRVEGTEIDACKRGTLSAPDLKKT